MAFLYLSVVLVTDPWHCEITPKGLTWFETMPHVVAVVAPA